MNVQWGTPTAHPAAEDAGVRQSFTSTSQIPRWILLCLISKARPNWSKRFSSSLSYAILRPAVLFGEGDILINNVAFMLKKFPLFAIPGGGEYRIQPISVDDLAD